MKSNGEKQRKPKGNYKCLNWTKRLQLDCLLKSKTPKKEIAKLLKVHISTIYREIERGQCRQKRYKYDIWGDKEIEYFTAYSPEYAQLKYEEGLKARGVDLKVGNDLEFCDYVEKRIVEDGLTPLAVIGEIKKNDLSFNTNICARTLYSYIDKGVFYRLSMEHLPIKSKRKHRKNRQVRASRAPRGESIENRPAVINDRTEFGHWEMDCIIGKTRETLLTLTERSTLMEIVIKLPNKKTQSVVHALNTLERKYGRKFRKVFKSITVDNGVEFSDCENMEKSVYGKNEKRTKFYYCHPYSSYERGQNERMNREVRRKLPKGTSFKNLTVQTIQGIQTWLNNYPRGVLGYATPLEKFTAELQKMHLKIAI